MKFLEIQTTDEDRKIFVNVEHIVTVEPCHNGFSRLILSTHGIIETLHTFGEIGAGIDRIRYKEPIIWVRCMKLLNPSFDQED